MLFLQCNKNLFKNLKNNLYTCKQPMLMANERFERAQDNFGKEEK